MRTLLAPFRKEDGDEVLSVTLIRELYVTLSPGQKKQLVYPWDHGASNGGMEKIHLAFYKDRRSNEEQVRWHFWRLEGPGFIWNYRVLPHVHCYVNITGNV